MRKSKLGIWAMLFLFVLSNINIPVAAADLIYETVDTQTITKGLTYEHRSKFTIDGWVDIYVLQMDLTEDQVAMEVLRSMGTYGAKETLTDMAEESDENVVGGVNGSFFNTQTTNSDPIGPAYDDGAYLFANQYYNTQGHGAASLIENEDGDVSFDFLGTTISFGNENGDTLYIEGINKLAVTGYPVVYNDQFGSDTSQVEDIGSFYKLVVSDEDKVIDVIGPDNVADIPEGGYVVAIPESMGKQYIDSYSPGTNVTLNVDTTIDTDQLKLAISGAGKVLEDGQVSDDGYFVLSNSRQPRTALGITEDGNTLVAMVIDGRGDSIGATHDELASYLKEYDVWDAIEMDAGGSSTMIARDLGDTDISVENSPSDGSQRKILNGLGFVSLAETGDVDTINVTASSDRVFKNNPIYLTITGYDENYNPVTIDDSKISWTVDGLDGTWETNTFYPSSVGTGTITCYYEGKTAKVSIESMDSPIDLTLSPQVLSLDQGESGSFSITGIDTTGYEGEISKEDVTYTLSDESLGSFEDGVFTAGDTDGITKVTVKMGDRQTSGYIAVGNQKEAVEDFDDLDYTSESYPEDSVEGTITKDDEEVVDGDTSYRFDYHFDESDETQAFYMDLSDFTITDPTESLSLWIYGNNTRHMVRAKITDATGEEHLVTLSSAITWDGWKEVTADLPKNMKYPLQLDQIYVVALESDEDYDGSLWIDSMSMTQSVDTSELAFDDEGFVSDPWMVNSKPDDAYEIDIFGATSSRNRLLDNVILSNVYDQLNTADYSVLAGKSDVDESLITSDHLVWDDSYQETTADKVKIITLATSDGGLRDTDYTQFDKLQETLRNTSQNTVVIIGNKNPLTSFDDEREGELLHQILADYTATTGKQIIYINGGGYDTNVTLKDGVRYIDLSGLWYQVQDRYVDLNKTFYTLRLFENQGEVTYMIEPMYPAVEVN